MYVRRLAAGLAVTLLVAAAMSGGPAHADTAQPSTLYVNNGVACGDSSSGTQAAPFCTVQAAADVVVPGQTVDVVWSSAPYSPFTVSRSGTASEPVTFQGVAPYPGDEFRTVVTLGEAPLIHAASGTAAITVTGSHVRVGSMYAFSDEADVVDVTGAQDVVLDSLMTQDASPSDWTGTGNAVTVDGTSSDVTVSRSGLSYGHGYGVQVAPGAQRVTVTADQIYDERLGGVEASGTSTVYVTGNSFYEQCGSAVSLDGGSSGAVENNVLATLDAVSTVSSTCPAPAAPDLSVAADSAVAVTADFNAFTTVSGRPQYGWGGTSYATTTDFQAATGQGAHDFGDLPGKAWNVVPEDSPVIDSGNVDAPGELTTDLIGAPRVDDPLVTDSGTGTDTYTDRGAIERQDAITLPADDFPATTTGPAPLDISVVTGDSTGSWGLPLTYTVDWGDATPVGTGTPGSVTTLTHTYTTAGYYDEKLTIADSDGSVKIRDRRITVGTTTPPQGTVTAHADIAANGKIDGGAADISLSTTDSWEVTTADFSCGDDNTSCDPTQPHQYDSLLTYHPSLTEKDILGRETTGSTDFTVTDALLPMAPHSDWHGTIPAHKAVKLTAKALKASGAGVDSAVLRVTVTGGTRAGTLSAYPHGAPKLSTALLTFAAGQTVSDQATIRLVNPAEDFYNGSSKPVTVTIYTVGVDSHAQYGRAYTPTAPVRLLDSAVAGGRSLTLPIAGTRGLSSGMAAAVLDVQTTGTTGAGHLDVSEHGVTGTTVTTSRWAKHQPVSSLLVVPLSDGKAVLRNGSTGTAHFTADLVGYANLTGTGSTFLPCSTAASQVLNTKISAHATLRLRIAGQHGVPSSGTTAVDLGLTASSPAAGGSLTVYPDGTARPSASNLLFAAGRTSANEAVPRVGSDGYVLIYNSSSKPVHVIAELYGSYLAVGDR